MKHLFFFFLLAAAGCHQSYDLAEPMVAIQIQDRNGLTETISAPDRLETYEMVDFLSAQPYKKVLRVFKKSGKNHSKITTYHPNGMIWQYLEAEEMRAHGAFREWFPNGQLKIEATIIGGTADVSTGSQQDWLFDGIARVWDERGKLAAEIPYSNGLLDGVSQYYYPDGRFQRKISFERDHLEGQGIEYYPDGSLKSETNYSKGLKEGSSTGFFPSGQTAFIEDYAEGLLRKGTYFDPRGALFSEVDNGGGYQAIFEGDTLASVVEIRLGKPEGQVQTFSPQGELKVVHHIKNGLKSGEEIHYYLSSEKESREQVAKLSLNWLENVVHGTIKTWYNNGQLQSQRDYCRNVKLGPAVGWYRDGTLMLIEEYEEDLLKKGQYFKKNQQGPVSSITNGNGIATLYDGDGIFLRKVTYFKGKPVDPED